MALAAMTGCAYFVGGADLTSQSNRLSLDAMVAELDGTTFGSNGVKEVFGGLESAAITAGGFVDFGSVSDVEQETYNDGRLLLPHTFGVSNSGAAVAAKAYVVKSLSTDIKLYGQVGELVPWDLTAAGSSKTGIGKFLAVPSTTISATGDGTAVQIGAVADGKYALASLHVLSRTGTATLDAVIESDVDSNFDGSETSRITFTQMSAVGSQFGSVAGPITDTYWRATFTVGGSGTMTVAIALGISLF
jgi:hypothetical protein